MQFTFITSGESHGKGLVAIIEGLPAGLAIDVTYINHQLWRRQQGYGRGGRMKIESDEAEILSGVRHGRTLGSPVSLLIRNRDFENWQDVMNVEPRDFAEEKRARRMTRPRPGQTFFSQYASIFLTCSLSYSPALKRAATAAAVIGGRAAPPWVA